MHVHRQRAFTLLEMMVVVAIAGILIALSFTTFSMFRQRNSVANTFIVTVQGLRRARAEAFGRGVRTAFVLDTAGKRWWSLEANAGVDLDLFDPAAPGLTIDSGTLPSTVSFGPAAGYGVQFPVPFASIPVLASQSVAPNYTYCSFCRTSGKNTGFGVVLFESDGRVAFNAGAPSAPGQQFTLTGGTGPETRTMAVAVLARTGLVEIFQK